jgi:hypothetical protein
VPDAKEIDTFPPIVTPLEVSVWFPLKEPKLKPGAPAFSVIPEPRVRLPSRNTKDELNQRPVNPVKFILLQEKTPVIVSVPPVIFMLIEVPGFLPTVVIDLEPVEPEYVKLSIGVPVIEYDENSENTFVLLPAIETVCPL